MHNFAKKKKFKKKPTHRFPEHYIPCLSSIEKQATKWQEEGHFHRTFNNFPCTFLNSMHHSTEQIPLMQLQALQVGLRWTESSKPENRLICSAAQNWTNGLNPELTQNITNKEMHLVSIRHWLYSVTKRRGGGGRRKKGAWEYSLYILFVKTVQNQCWTSEQACAYFIFHALWGSTS